MNGKIETKHTFWELIVSNKQEVAVVLKCLSLIRLSDIYSLTGTVDTQDELSSWYAELILTGTLENCLSLNLYVARENFIPEY